MRKIDAGRHRGVWRGTQKQELRDAEPQDVMDDEGARRQRRVEAIGDQRVDLAEPAQDGSDQQAGEGAVAYLQSRHCRVVFDRVIERPFAAENHPDQIEGDLAG